MIKATLMIRRKSLPIRLTSNAMRMRLIRPRTNIIGRMTHTRVITTIRCSIMINGRTFNVLQNRPLIPNFRTSIKIRNLRTRLNLFNLKRSSFEFTMRRLPLRINLTRNVIIGRPSNARSNANRMRNGKQPRSTRSRSRCTNLFRRRLSYLTSFIRRGLSIMTQHFFFNRFRGIGEKVGQMGARERPRIKVVTSKYLLGEIVLILGGTLTF